MLANVVVADPACSMAAMVTSVQRRHVARLAADSDMKVVQKVLQPLPK
jgi:hypothetical protein